GAGRPGDWRRGRRARRSGAGARAARGRGLSRSPPRAGGRGRAAVARWRRRHRHRRTHPPSPRARAGGPGSSADDRGRRDRRRGERPPARSPLTRPGVAGDPALLLPSDLAPRRSAVGAALVLERRAACAGRPRGRPSAGDPRVSGAGPVAGGPLVTAADVIVVGAGPAGPATAILLAEPGVSVRLVDRARFPRPKICGEYLSPEVPRLLDRLGALKAVDAVARPLAGMRITAPDGTALVGEYRRIGPWRPRSEERRVGQGCAVGLVACDQYKR